MVFEKKGQYSTIWMFFLIAALILAGVAGIDILYDAKQRIDGTLLEKNFIARDLAMTLEAIYGSPGDITYTYDLGSYKYLIDINNKVSVRETPSDTNPVAYRIVGSSRVTPPDFKMTSVDEKKPLKLILSKKFNDDGSAVITVKRYAEVENE